MEPPAHIGVGEAAGPEGFEFVGVKQEPLEEPEDGEFIPQEPECIIVQKEDPCDDNAQPAELDSLQNSVNSKMGPNFRLENGDKTTITIPEDERKSVECEAQNNMRPVSPVLAPLIPKEEPEPECIIVQKEEPCDDEGQPEELACVQVHADVVRQKLPNIPAGAVNREELILGLVPETEWVPPCLPEDSDAPRDPLASEGDEVPDSVNGEQYATGWSDTPHENQDIPSGGVDYNRVVPDTVNGGGLMYIRSATTSCKSTGTETVQQAFRCDECWAIFSSKYNLVNHVFAHIPEAPAPSHVCRHCGDVFCDTASLIDHAMAHETKSQAPAALSKWGRGPARSCRRLTKCRVRKWTLETDSHVCDLCGKSSCLLGNLISHMRTHSGERPYSCDVCGKAFVQSVHLQNHRVTHTAEKRHYCEFCGQPFTQLRGLKLHLRVHTGENPYTCEICGAAFHLLEKLKTHKQVHTGRKPYKCDECGNCFTAPNSLKRHKRKHTDEKPYVCDLCGEAFMWAATLRKHKLLHTGEKPFHCDLCGSSFAELGGLNRHMRIHTGERPYACDICGASFSSSSHMKRHRRRCHEKQS